MRESQGPRLDHAVGPGHIHRQIFDDRERTIHAELLFNVVHPGQVRIVTVNG